MGATLRNSFRLLRTIPLVLALPTGPALADVGDVVATFPAPGFYSTGLAWDGSHLWLTNIAEAAHPETSWYRFYRLDPSDGSVVSSFPTWPAFYHGIAWNGTHLWGEHNWDTLSRLTTTGIVLQNVDAPAFFAYGAAFDPVADVLWTTCFQGANTAIFKVDPADGSQLQRLTPAENTTDSGWADLAWDGTTLWHSNTTDDVVYRIDTGSGAILDQFPAPADDCSGITFDGTHLWLASSSTDTIYRVDAGIPSSAPAIASGDPLRVVAFPNPARGEVRFSIGTTDVAPLSGSIHDVTGRLVARISPGASGSFGLAWNGRGPDGRCVGPGVYFLRLSSGGATAHERFVLLR